MPKFDGYDIKPSPATDDQILILDVHDGSQSSDGSTKRATIGSLPGQGGGGAVTSVNGQVGVVVLGAADVSAVPSAEAGAANGVATLDGTTKVPAAQIPQLPDYAPAGLTGATAATAYAGGTVSGHPLSGTWAVGQWIMDQTGQIWVCIGAGTPGTWVTVGQQPWQFRPEQYGAKRDGALLYDVSVTNGSAVLTTAGLPAPAFWVGGGAMIAGSATGGTITAGVVQVQTTYVNAHGETLPSATASYTAAGTTSSITVNSPQPWTNATSYNVYATAPGGATFFKLNTSPIALRTAYKITVNPSSGAAPPVANTSNSAPFTAADAGKHIVIPSAGGFANVPLSTTIASYQSATQVTLATNALSTVTGQGALYGTDDTAALQACINAMQTYWQGQGEETLAEMLLSLGIYVIAGAPGGALQNSQLQIPHVNPYAGPKVHFKITGPLPAMGPVHWEQPNPPVAGAVLASTYYNDSGTPLSPAQSVISGPVENAAQGIFFGGNGGLFSNMRVIVDGLNILVPYRCSIHGLNLFGVGQADIRSFGYFALARTAGASAGGWPLYVNASNPSPWAVSAYVTPTLGNNDLNVADRVCAYGPYTAVTFADHFSARDIQAIFCNFAVTASGGGHHCTIQSLSSEATFAAVYNDGTAAQGLTIASVHCENATFIIDDPSDLFYGEVFAEQLGATGYLTWLKNGGTNIKLRWSPQALGPIAAPQAPPATGVAWKNAYGLDAEVTLSITGGGALTGLLIDAVDQHLPAGCVMWKFRLPEGHSYTPTYTGTLAHDVTLD